MTPSLNDDADSNPFATRRTRPGALPFLFDQQGNAARFVSQLREHDWWGAIVGPHGSGKSTLLAEIQPALRAAGRHVQMYVLHAGERRLPKQTSAPLTSDTQVIVDGYEQLSWWSRYKLHLACRRARAGLLVTSHQQVRGIPTLYMTRCDLELARTLAAQLLAGRATQLSDTEIEAAFQSAHGNLREMWFQLFDVYEKKD